MFFGEYQHSLDIKNRIIIPAKFRPLLGERPILTWGLDKCIFIFAQSEWASFTEKILKLPISDDGARRFSRFFSSGVYEPDQDAQGRVLIPPYLKQYAELDKDAVLIGVINRIEIWSRENWQAYKYDSNFIDNELAHKMAELGI